MSDQGVLRLHCRHIKPTKFKGLGVSTCENLSPKMERERFAREAAGVYIA